MKKFVSLIILLILFNVLLVTAGEVLKLDLTGDDAQITKPLKEGDMAEFYLKGERNTVIIDKIKPDSVDVTAFLALNTGNYPYYVTLSDKKTLMVDIERDGTGDLYVGWYKSDETLEHVYLFFKKADNLVTGNVVGNDLAREFREYDKYIIGGFIFIIILLIFFIYKYKE